MNNNININNDYDALKNVRIMYPYPKDIISDLSFEDAYEKYLNLTFKINTEFDVNEELVSDIYYRLNKIYPKSSNKTLIKYLNASLFNITTKKCSKEQSVKRIKRLKERNSKHGFN